MKTLNALTLLWNSYQPVLSNIKIIALPENKQKKKDKQTKTKNNRPLNGI